jgi:hypothetical protein
VDVGLGAFRLAARSDRADDLALADGRLHSDRDRPQVNQGDRVSVLRADRQAPAFVRHLAGEGDDSRRRSAYVCARRCADVDSAVLPARVRVVADHEGSEHRALDRPAPPGRGRHESERTKQNRNAVA